MAPLEFPTANGNSALPDRIGPFASGRGDFAERHEEILRDER
jgi:hypothetical protein